MEEIRIRCKNGKYYVEKYRKTFWGWRWKSVFFNPFDYEDSSPWGFSSLERAKKSKEEYLQNLDRIITD